MQKFVSSRGLRPLDPHQSFALDPLEASRQPPDPLLSTAPPVQKCLDPPLMNVNKSN
jgi:hypothetical protein